MIAPEWPSADAWVAAAGGQGDLDDDGVESADFVGTNCMSDSKAEERGRRGLVLGGTADDDECSVPVREVTSEPRTARQTSSIAGGCSTG